MNHIEINLNRIKLLFFDKTLDWQLLSQKRASPEDRRCYRRTKEHSKPNFKDMCTLVGSVKSDVKWLKDAYSRFHAGFLATEFEEDNMAGSSSYCQQPIFRAHG